mmetsp:Transcript_14891/g.56465  ORF Transcript_14891/g.56465 Transcript_14891/m.56465 type:complete len:245 (+) Transcript_14891:1159-1893(+)
MAGHQGLLLGQPVRAPRLLHGVREPHPLLLRHLKLQLLQVLHQGHDRRVGSKCRRGCHRGDRPDLRKPRGLPRRLSQRLLEQRKEDIHIHLVRHHGPCKSWLHLLLQRLARVHPQRRHRGRKRRIPDDGLRDCGGHVAKQGRGCAIHGSLGRGRLHRNGSWARHWWAVAVFRRSNGHSRTVQPPGLRPAADLQCRVPDSRCLPAQVRLRSSVTQRCARKSVVRMDMLFAVVRKPFGLFGDDKRV